MVLWLDAIINHYACHGLSDWPRSVAWWVANGRLSPTACVCTQLCWWELFFYRTTNLVTSWPLLCACPVRFFSLFPPCFFCVSFLSGHLATEMPDCTNIRRGFRVGNRPRGDFIGWGRSGLYAILWTSMKIDSSDNDNGDALSFDA